MTNHVLGDGGFRDLDAEFKEFTVDARCTPQTIVATYGSNELPRFFCHRRASGFAMANFPSPVPAESLSVPGDDGARLENGECRFPSRPEPREEEPEPSISSAKLRFGRIPLQDTNLMPEGQQLDLSLGCGSEVDAKRGEGQRIGRSYRAEG